MTHDIPLPQPALTSTLSVEAAILKRHSVRSFTKEPLTLAQLAQLLWAAQGITHPHALRSAPSAGALYPLKLYCVVGNVSDLPAGIYAYNVQKHTLTKCSDGDHRADLCTAAYSQASVEQAPASLVISGVYDRVAQKYGDKAPLYTWAEAGGAAENVALQAVSLHLGTVYVGAFESQALRTTVGMAPDEHPLCILPLGSPVS